MQIPASIVFQKNWQAYQKGYKILLNEGSSRSTKTWSFFLLMYLFCKENASKRIVVMRDTQKACRELVETEFKDWLKDPYSRKKQFENGLITSQQLRDYLNKENLLTDLLENKSNHTYTFSNDSRIIFTGADNIEQVIGKENHLVWINEPYKFSDKVLKELVRRLDGILLIDWNPISDHYIEKFKSRKDCKVIHSTFLDNPFLSQTVRNEILSTKPLLNKYFKFDVEHLKHILDKTKVIQEIKQLTKDKEIQQEILYRWTNEQQKTASDYDWMVFGLGVKSEKPNKVYHGWQTITAYEFDDLEYNSYYGLDFGQTNPTALIEVKYNDGTFYVKELLYRPGKQIESLPDLFKTLEIDKKRAIICDVNDEQSIRSLRNGGYYVMKAKKGRVFGGVSLIQRANVIYVNESLNLKKEYETYEWETDRYNLPTDKTVKKDDHLLDAMRYAVMYMQIKLKISL